MRPASRGSNGDGKARRVSEGLTHGNRKNRFRKGFPMQNDIRGEIATRALVRRPARSYREYYARRDVQVSLADADRQHDAYIRGLQAAGLAVAVVEADENFPDGVFIEDTAIVWGQHTLRTRLWRDREGEQDMVTEALRATHTLTTMPPGATLDGGDVLHLGEVTYVGLSSRTNETGVEAVRAFLAPFGRRVIAVPVQHCLHLKTAATSLGNNTALAAPGLIDIGFFEGVEVLFTDPSEPGAANCLRVGDHLLIAAGYPRTRLRLEAFAKEFGVRLVPLEISEFEKGDGSLSCLSILW